MKICKIKEAKLLLIALLSASSLLQACNDNREPNVPTKPPGILPVESKFNYIFEQGKSGYEVYRIPAIIKTKENTLLAFSEARKLRSDGDSGDIDVVVKRSVDNGKTWNAQIVIWSDGENTCGNPVPIIDNKGRVHLLTTWNHRDDKWGTLTNGTGINTRRPYYCYSDDHGLTWSQPVEITASIKKTGWDWYGTGPCHGIQLKTGSYKNRLLAPNYFTTKENGKVVSYSHTAYSDDYGKTWKAGNPTPMGNVGECSIAELPNGSVILNMRTEEGFYRKQSISSDGGISWSAPETKVLQLDAKCHGSVLVMGNSLFLSNAAAATRTNMTVRRSENNGTTWSGKHVVYTGYSGYSDLVQVSDSEIAIFYEGGEKRYTDGLAFKVINLKSIK